MADFQHYPYPDSRFAKIFEEAFPTLNCTSRYLFRPLMLDDKLKDFGSSIEEDDLSNLDLMPPPLFSKVSLTQIYKYTVPKPLR
jgi:hypothetical protein